MIRLENVKKTLGTHIVLDGVDLQINKGETMVIIGRSGSGKSVTLKHMVGLMHPDSGKIFIDGVDIASLNRKGLFDIRRKFGVLFQNGALINWLSVYANVALPLREHTNLNEEEIKTEVTRRLEMLELRDHANKMPHDLSGGMRKRAALARAIILNPEIMLYDEPTAGLDPVMASMVDKLVTDVKEQLGVTSVVVTHDMKSAYTIADRIAMLYHGKIVQVGTPDEIRSSTNDIVRQFVEGRIEGPME